MFRQQASDDLEMVAWEPAHAGEKFALIEANRDYLRRWLPWVDREKSLEDALAFIRRATEQAERNDGFHAGIWRQDRLVGAIGLHYVDWAHRKTEMGYWVAEAEQGQGIITRCCRALLERIFDDWKLNRVVIFCAAQNQRSRAIPERLGFTHEGTYRQAEWLYDHFVDLAGYGLLAEEWARSRGSSSRTETGGSHRDTETQRPT
jgi:ribosomal-protein-serine acetyltransferase